MLLNSRYECPPSLSLSHTHTCLQKSPLFEPQKTRLKRPSPPNLMLFPNLNHGSPLFTSYQSSTCTLSTPRSPPKYFQINPPHLKASESAYPLFNRSYMAILFPPPMGQGSPPLILAKPFFRSSWDCIRILSAKVCHRGMAIALWLLLAPSRVPSAKICRRGIAIALWLLLAPSGVPRTVQRGDSGVIVNITHHICVV